MEEGHLPFGMESGDMSRFKRRLLRTKTMQQPSMDGGSQPGEGELQKVLTTGDLISLGVGSCAGTGMYVVAGLVAKNVAGPAALLSFLFAALASILSGVCYGEFGVRVPKTSGSAYMYSYVTVGEFVAFLIGWNLILEYMIGSAAGASALSACFDALANHSMSAYLEENVGTVIGKTYPDFLGFFIGIIMTVVLAMGVKKSVRFNNVLNAINLVVWIFIIIAGLFYVKGENWTLYGGFAPYGASGVFSGAATCFYAFIGFDIIATTGEEARNPSRSIPIAIVVSLVVCLAAYISVTTILSLMVPYWDIHGDSALIDMFMQRGANGAKWVVAIGSLSALTVSLLGSMFPMPRVIYAMSRDGLLFGFLSTVHPYTGTPVFATVITGLLASFMSLLVGLQILVEMMSIGTLLAYTLVSVSVLILRYQPSLHELPIPMAHRLDTIDEDGTTPSEEFASSDNIIGVKKVKLKDNEMLISPSGDGQPSYGSLPFGGTAVETTMAYIARHAKICWLRCGFPSDDALPNEATAKTAILFTGALAICQSATCMMVVFGSAELSRGEPWAILLLLAFLGSVVACFVFIMRQPQNKKKLPFMAPAVPILPGCAMFVNIYLMLKLPGLTWARLGIWICLGLLLYFSYSMWHSVKERKQREKDAAEKAMQQTEQDMVNAVGSQPENQSENGTGPGSHAPPGGPLQAETELSSGLMRAQEPAQYQHPYQEHVPFQQEFASFGQQQQRQQPAPASQPSGQHGFGYYEQPEPEYPRQRYQQEPDPWAESVNTHWGQPQQQYPANSPWQPQN